MPAVAACGARCEHADTGPVPAKTVCSLNRFVQPALLSCVALAALLALAARKKQKLVGVVCRIVTSASALAASETASLALCMLCYKAARQRPLAARTVSNCVCLALQF